MHFFLMLGTVGYRASLMFVRHIYRCGPLLKPACSLLCRLYSCRQCHMLFVSEGMFLV